MKLSHTKLEKYQTCPRKYFYYYVEKLRSKYMSSALWFGGYIGDTVQMMVLDKKPQLTEEEKEIAGTDPYEFFDKLMSTVTINDEEHLLPVCPYIRYFKGDYDEELLKSEDHEQIRHLADDLGLRGLSWDDLYPRYKSGSLDEDEYRYMNFIFWLCMRRRGHMMIDAYKEDVLPRIHEVHAIEKPISIKEQEHGEDEIIGYIDMICDFELDDGTINTVLFDHKTSSKRYKLDKLFESQQLSLYDYCEEIGLVGYIVMIKPVKRPKRGKDKGKEFIDVQIITHSIPTSNQVNHLENAIEILEGIENKEFNKEYDACFAFGSQCEYTNICKNGAKFDENLINMKEKRDAKEKESRS